MLEAQEPEYNLAHLHDKEPLAPPENEDEMIQADIIGYVTTFFMDTYQIPPSLRLTVQNAIGLFWVTHFSAAFNERCREPPDRMKPDLYAAMESLDTEGRMDLVLHELGFADFEDFLVKQDKELKAALMAAGIDLDVIDQVSDTLH